jgi:hypothetical protein
VYAIRKPSATRRGAPSPQGDDRLRLLPRPSRQPNPTAPGVTPRRRGRCASGQPYEREETIQAAPHLRPLGRAAPQPLCQLRVRTFYGSQPSRQRLTLSLDGLVPREERLQSGLENFDGLPAHGTRHGK